MGFRVTRLPRMSCFGKCCKPSIASVGCSLSLVTSTCLSTFALRQGQLHSLDEASVAAQVPTNPLRTRRIEFGLSSGAGSSARRGQGKQRSCRSPKLHPGSNLLGCHVASCGGLRFLGAPPPQFGGGSDGAPTCALEPPATRRTWPWRRL